MGSKASKKLVKKLEPNELQRYEQVHRAVAGSDPTFTAEQLANYAFGVSGGDCGLAIAGRLCSMFAATSSASTSSGGGAPAAPPGSGGSSSAAAASAKKEGPRVGASDFVAGVACMCMQDRTAVKERPKIIFGMIDVNGDGTISKEDMATWLTLSLSDDERSFIESWDKPAVNLRVDQIFARADLKDKNGFSWHDFDKWTSQNPPEWLELQSMINALIKNAFVKSTPPSPSSTPVVSGASPTTSSTNVSPSPSPVPSNTPSSASPAPTKPTETARKRISKQFPTNPLAEGEKADSEKSTAGSKPSSTRRELDDSDSASHVSISAMDFSDDEDDKKPQPINIVISATSLIDAKEEEANKKVLAEFTSQLSFKRTVGAQPSRRRRPQSMMITEMHSSSPLPSNSVSPSPQLTSSEPGFGQFDSLQAESSKAPLFQASDSLREAMHCMECADYSKGLANVQHALELLASENCPEERLQCVSYKVALQLLQKIHEIRANSPLDLEAISLLSHLLAGVPLRLAHRAASLRICIYYNVEANNPTCSIPWIKSLLTIHPPDTEYLESLLAQEEEKLKQMTIKETQIHACFHCKFPTSSFARECSTCGDPLHFDFQDFFVLDHNKEALKCSQCCATYLRRDNLELNSHCPTCVSGILGVIEATKD
ncbi:hypothetical protein Pelo_7566 [Pelomyxa schiedti]|nr:hypothetical protein Pelo_7566 [Pelomyxa schiedti]